MVLIENIAQYDFSLNLYGHPGKETSCERLKGYKYIFFNTLSNTFYNKFDTAES